MTDHNETAGMVARWRGLSTGLKMLLILGLGLLPLGVVAVLASLYSAQDNWSRDEVEMRAVLSETAQRLSVAVVRSAVIIRASAPALAVAPGGGDLCRRTMDRVAPMQVAPVRYAVFGPGNRPLCATAGYLPPAELASAAGRGPGLHLGISPDGRLLRFALVDEAGKIEGTGEFVQADLARLVALPRSAVALEYVLAQGGREMVLHRGAAPRGLQKEMNFERAVAAGVDLRMRGAASRFSAAELLLILLPILMLAFAALVGWWIVGRLLLRPLVRMERAVASYRPGDPGLDLPALRSPAREIGDLGRAFDDVARTVARHEAELEAAVERQTRLVREVHHRVKNNLQVVASLLNLHARGATSDDVAAAYASIQRRVDALAVVHRNHYAELEDSRGVALRSLIAELAANLRATAPSAASAMQIRLDIEPFFGTQDTAVSVAFLITEIVEFGMLCGATSVAISLEGAGPTHAALAVESDALIGDVNCDSKLFERFDRIVTGLSRQLRSTLDRDTERGIYTVKIAVIDRGEG